MILLFYVILILTKWPLIQPIIYFDNPTIFDNYKPEGPVLYKIFLKSLDLFYDKYAPYQCNFDSQYDLVGCDLIMASQFCALNLTHDAEWSDYYNRYNFYFDTRSTVAKKDEPDDDYPGTCTKINITKFASNISYFYFDNTNLIPMAKLKLQKFAYHSTTAIRIATKDPLKFVTIDFGPVFFAPIRPNISLSKSIHRKLHNLDVLKSQLFLEISIQSYCQNGYTGQTCWIRCESEPSRYTCKCPENQRFSSTPCKYECRDGWLQLYSTKVIAGFHYSLTSCNMKDYCYNTSKYCESRCLTLSNSSGICGDIQVFLTSDLHLGNITSNNFIDSEVITASLNKYYVPNIKIFEYGKVSIKNTKLLERYNITHNVPDGHSSVAKFKFIVKDQYIENTYRIYIFVKLQHWKTEFEYSKDFRIYKKPSNLQMYDKHVGKKIGSGSKLTVGNKIICNSSGRPLFRVIVLLDLKDFLIPQYPTDNMILPINAVLNFNALIGCKASLMIKGRKNIVSRIYRHVLIKGLLYHYWTPKENIITVDDKKEITCRARNNLEYVHIVYETQGYQELTINGNQVYYKNVKEMVYHLKCGIRLKVDRGFHFITISKQISFKRKLSHVCFYLFPEVIGSIVQCSHDGLFKDSYEVTMEIIYAGKIFRKKQSYIQIPYDFVNGLEVEVNCNIKLPDTGEIVTETTKFLLSSKVANDYGTSRILSDCLVSPYRLDDLTIRKSDRFTYTIQHLLLTLRDEPLLNTVIGGYVIWNNILFYFLNHLVLIICMITFLMTLNYGSIDASILKYRVIRSKRRWIRLRKLQDELMVQALFSSMIHTINNKPEVRGYNKKMYMSGSTGGTDDIRQINAAPSYFRTRTTDFHSSSFL